MRSDSEEKSPFGRGFVAACIVVGAVLLCGVLLLVSALISDDSRQAAVPTPDAPVTTRVQPVARSSGCGPGTDDHAIPSTAPSVDSWEVSRRVVVPRSRTFGPARTDPDGFRHCFAQSPTGAVFAAYNVVAAFADQDQAIATIRKLMVPGPDTDALLRAQREAEPSDSAPTQVAGFRVVDAAQDRATIMLALPVESAYMSITVTVSWYDGDWRVQSPPPGEALGAPFSQHRDLGDFVAWSGV